MSHLAENQLCARFDCVSSGTEATVRRRPAWRTDPEKGVLAVRAHAGMVYGTSQRLLGEDEIALDSTRATFLHWLGNTREMEGLACSWLHRAAVAQARSLWVDREDEWGVAGRRDKPERGSGFLWRQVSRALDETLATLDDESHSVLVRHFLEGHMLGEIALDDRDSRPSVVRRVEGALKQLCERLKARGVTLSVAALEIQMRKAVTAAPAIVLSELSRLVLQAWARPGTTPRSPAAPVQFDSPWVRPASRSTVPRQLENGRRRKKRRNL